MVAGPPCWACAGGFCSWVAGADPCLAACAPTYAKRAAKSSAPAMKTVCRRLFMVLKPNFILKLSARASLGCTSIAPLRGILQGGSNPAGSFTAGHLSLRKVYMHSLHKLLMQCVTATVAVIFVIPPTPPHPSLQAPVI